MGRREGLTAVETGTHRSEFTCDGLDLRVRIVEKESGSDVFRPFNTIPAPLPERLTEV